METTLAAPLYTAPEDSAVRRWAGRIITALPVLFLVFDTTVKLAHLGPAVESTRQLGYPAGSLLAIGIIELGCVLAYIVPRTSIIGAVLLTGYLGGAIATHVRAGSPLLSHVLFPIYVAVLIWGGLYLRDRRLRAVLR